jgi:hypothetical protein
VSEALIEEIKRRCVSGGLTYEEQEDSLRIDFPKGRETHSIWVDYDWDEHARLVLSEPPRTRTWNLEIKSLSR